MEGDREARRVMDAMESHAWTLVFSFLALFIAAASIFVLFRDSPALMMVMMAPVIVLLVFMFYTAEDWAGHRRTLHGMKAKK